MPVNPTLSISVRGHRWSVSPLLGARARNVYESLLEALAVGGDVAECGSHEGITAGEMARYLAENEPERSVHVFDTFGGFPEVLTEEERGLSTWDGLAPGAYATSLAIARERLSAFPNCHIYAGTFADTFPGFDRPLCFIHSDSDLYQSTCETIELAERCLRPGGRILFDDYGNPRLPGVQLAVDRHLDPARFRGARLPHSIQFVAERRP